MHRLTIFQSIEPYNIPEVVICCFHCVKFSSIMREDAVYWLLSLLLANVYIMPLREYNLPSWTSCCSWIANINKRVDHMMGKKQTTCDEKIEGHLRSNYAPDKLIWIKLIKCTLNSNIITSRYLILIMKINWNKIDYWEMGMFFYLSNKIISKFFACPFFNWFKTSRKFNSVHCSHN